MRMSLQGGLHDVEGVLSSSTGSIGFSVKSIILTTRPGLMIDCDTLVPLHVSCLDAMAFGGSDETCNFGLDNF
jgi:hypothetical protein